jgi:hypothetical protein
MYCRKCGYQLEGLSENRCPECGRLFDPAKRKTFYSRPGDWEAMRWVRRVVAGFVGIILCILLARGAVDGWVYWHYHKDWKAEQAAIAAINRLGGRVDTVYDGPIWPIVVSGVGHYIDRAYGVALYKKSIQDGDLECLKGLPKLQELNLYHSQITDGALASLEGLRLTGLNLRGALINDAGLVHLKGLGNLRWVELQDTKITDAAAEQLARLTQLRTLGLDGTLITDASLPCLTKLSSLRSLSLSGTSITDAGLESLKSSSNLRHLDVSGTRVTPEGVRKLRQARPNIDITR